MDCDIVQEILTEPAGKEPLRFPKKYAFLQQIAGSGVPVLEGEAWSRHRRILQPCLQHRYIRDTLVGAIPPLLERFMTAWDNAAARGRIIDASSHMSALTLVILGAARFSHDFHGVCVVEEWASKESQGEEDLSDIADPLLRALKASFKLSLLQVFLTIVGASNWINILDQKACRSRQMLDQAGPEIHEKRKKRMPASAI